MKNISRTRRALGAAIAAQVLTLPRAFANRDALSALRSVTLIVPFPAGGRTDIAARVLAPRLERVLKLPVIVANRPGAGSAVGTRFVADAASDGGTLLFTSSALVASQYLVETGVAVSEFTALGIVARAVPVLVVGPASSAGTLREFLSAGNAAPVQFGLNAGGSSHLVTERLIEVTSLPVNRVPFKGDSDALQALAGGHVDAYMAPYAAIRSLLEARRVRPLAVASRTRISDLSGVGTFREQGVDFVSESFEGLFASRSVPAAASAVIESALREVMAADETLAAMRQAGLDPAWIARAEAERFVRAQDDEFFRTASRLGLLKNRAGRP